MDEIKDIEKKDQISRFLDGTKIRIQPFGHNILGDRAYRRAERLVAAIYLVTNHVPSDEPACVLSRRTSLHLLSLILLLRDEMRVPGSGTVKKTHASIRELISLVRILSVAGYVSQQNAEALVEALDELGVFLLTSQRTALSESVTLTREELLVAEGLSASHLSDATVKKQRRAIKDKLVGMGRVSDRANKIRIRGEGIVAILKAQGQLGIKDISANLPEFSEKMIQRELKGLVGEGRIKKVGSKRWSTYSLAQ